jgi:hypothetical protein
MPEWKCSVSSDDIDGGICAAAVAFAVSAAGRQRESIRIVSLMME